MNVSEGGRGSRCCCSDDSENIEWNEKDKRAVSTPCYERRMNLIGRAHWQDTCSLHGDVEPKTGKDEWTDSKTKSQTAWGQHAFERRDSKYISLAMKICRYLNGSSREKLTMILRMNTEYVCDTCMIHMYREKRRACPSPSSGCSFLPPTKSPARQGE